jgi:large subunit ribosomal protein L30
MAKQLEITLRRSCIGHPEKHKRVAVGLGLRKLNRTVVRPDTPEIRGMVRRISHLLEVREVEAKAKKKEKKG